MWAYPPEGEQAAQRPQSRVRQWTDPPQLGTFGLALLVSHFSSFLPPLLPPLSPAYFRSTQSMQRLLPEQLLTWTGVSLLGLVLCLLPRFLVGRFGRHCCHVGSISRRRSSFFFPFPARSPLSRGVNWTFKRDENRDRTPVEAALLASWPSWKN